METGDGTPNGDGANGIQQGNNGGGQLYENVNVQALNAQALQGLRVRNMVQVALDNSSASNFSLQQMNTQGNLFQGASIGSFMDSQGDQADFQTQFQNQQKALAQTQQQQQQQLAPQQPSLNPTFPNLAELYFGQQGLPAQPHMSVDPFRNQPVYDPTGSQFQQFSGRPNGQEQGGNAAQMALTNGLSLVGQGGLGSFSSISNMLYGQGSAGLLRAGVGGLGVSSMPNLSLNMGGAGDLLQPQLNLGSNSALLQAQQVLMQQQQQTQALLQQQAQQQQQQQQVELLLSQLHAMRQRQQQQIQSLLQTHQLEQLDLLARLQAAMGGASIMPSTQPTTPTTQQQQQQSVPHTPQRSEDGDMKLQQADANQQPTTTAPPTPQKTPNEVSENTNGQTQTGTSLTQNPQPKSGGNLPPPTPTHAPPPPPQQHTAQETAPPKQQKTNAKQQTRATAPATNTQGQTQDKTQHLTQPRGKVLGTTPPGTRPTSPQPTQPPQRPPSATPASPKHVPGAPPFPPMHMPYMPPPHIPWFPGMPPPPFLVPPGAYPGPPRPPGPMGMYSVKGAVSSEKDGSGDHEGSGNDSDSDRRRDDAMYSTEESEAVSQKRERNSAASTRFRMRKKQKMLELQRATQEMANKCNQLEQECAALEQDVTRLKARLTHGAEVKQEPNADGTSMQMQGGQAKPYNYQEHAAKFGMVRGGGEQGARAGAGNQRTGGGSKQKQQK